MQVTDILERHKARNALIITVLIATAGLTSCSDLSETQTRRVQEALEDTLLSSTESWNIKMEMMEEGEKKVEVRGSYAATYNLEDLRETRIDGPVFVQVFDSTGSVETRVTSNRAVYRARQSEFELYGNVIVRAEEGRRLESEYLKWDQMENRISSPRFVIITTPSDSIAGNGFEGSTDLSEYIIGPGAGQTIID